MVDVVRTGPKMSSRAIDENWLTPPNYKFPAPATLLGSAQQDAQSARRWRRPGARRLRSTRTSTTPADCQLAKGVNMGGALAGVGPQRRRR